MKTIEIRRKSDVDLAARSTASCRQNEKRLPRQSSWKRNEGQLRHQRRGDGMQRSLEAQRPASRVALPISTGDGDYAPIDQNTSRVCPVGSIRCEHRGSKTPNLFLVYTNSDKSLIVCGF